MEVLAGYDSGSSDENAKIQQNSADKQVRNTAERFFYMSAMYLSCVLFSLVKRS